MEGDEDDESVRIAIAALGSLKTGKSGSGKGQRDLHEITLPPISALLQERGQSTHASQLSHPHGTHYHPYGGSGPASSSASASTSALTFSPATTPSAITATSGSSPSSPSNPDRPPYSTRYIRNEDGQLVVTPSDAGSIFIDQVSQYTGEGDPMQGDEGFIGRVSHFPIVSGALKVYEKGRNSSKVVKYGTDLVENSVKTVSKPVIKRVIGPSLVGQIDDFACRQLDRFGPRTTSPPRDSPRSNETPLQSEQQQHVASYFPPPETYYRRPNGKGRAFPNYTQGTEQDDVSISPTSETPTLDSHYSPSSSTTHSAAVQQQQIIRSSSATRSRWQNLVIEAGVTAGGIGAAVSEESMKSLKYCLHWLHYATAHLDHQVGILREFILSLSPKHRSAGNILVRSEDARAANVLDGIKRDVVETIRKVVDVVSTYAGAALPEQARRYVRSSILGLPDKWARAMQSHHHQHQQQQVENDSQSQEMQTEEPQEDAFWSDQSPTRLGPTEAAAERTLTFALESLDMLRGVLNIFNDSVERADAWVERLRIVGLQRQQALSAHQRQNRYGHSTLPQRRGSTGAPYPTIASVTSASTASHSASGTSTGIKRREEDSGEMQQRRKNSRTSGLRETIVSAVQDGEGNEGMDMEE